MTDCTIDVAVESADELAAAVSSPTSIAASVVSPTSLSAAASSVGTISAAVSSSGTISAAISSPTVLSAAVVVSDTITATVVDYRQMELDFVTSMALASQPDQRQVRKLAQSSTSTSITETPTRLPTALLLFPTCKDCGYIEWTISASHANMNGLTVTFELWAGVYGSETLIKTWTSPAFAAGAGNLNFDMKAQLKFQGPLTQATWAQMSWRDGASVENIQAFTGRTSPTIDTGNYSNGDDGDLHAYIMAYVSGPGGTFNVRTFQALQYAIRSGFA